jgi:hypothetical protein
MSRDFDTLQGRAATREVERSSRAGTRQRRCQCRHWCRADVRTYGWRRHAPLWQYFSRLLAGAVMAIAHPSGLHPPRLARRGGGEGRAPVVAVLRVVWTMTVDDRPNRAAVAEFRLVSSTPVKWSSAASSLAFTLCPIFSITARSPCGVRNAISLQIAETADVDRVVHPTRTSTF